MQSLVHEKAIRPSCVNRETGANRKRQNGIFATKKLHEEQADNENCQNCYPFAYHIPARA